MRESKGANAREGDCAEIPYDIFDLIIISSDHGTSTSGLLSSGIAGLRIAGLQSPGLGLQGRRQGRVIAELSNGKVRRDVVGSNSSILNVGSYGSIQILYRKLLSQACSRSRLGGASCAAAVAVAQGYPV